MQKVIITGADGFVGSYTVQYFLEQGIEVLAIGHSSVPHRLKPHPALKYLACDISDSGALLAAVPAEEYDTFIHFAWTGSAGKARIDCQLQLRNALDTVACVKVAKQLGCSRFIGAGSIMEYEIEASVHAQGSKPGLGYIYGIAKHTAHCLSKSVAVDVGIEFIWPMITNAYGIGETSPRLINMTLKKILRGEPLQFTVATQNYDFVYVSDVAKAFYLIALNGRAFCEYMIGSGHAKTLREFILELQKECAPNAVPLFGEVPFTGTNIPIKLFDISDLEKDCGYRPEISFRSGVKKTMNWIRGREEDSMKR